ncbi:leucine-rich repeat-containing protein [Tanacetum coccineum]
MGLNMRLEEEEEQLFSEAKEDSRVSKASRKCLTTVAKCGVKTVSNDLERCLSLPEGSSDGDDGRGKSSKMRTTAANVAARAAVGGDDMLSKWQVMAKQARQKRESGADWASTSQPSLDVGPKPVSTSKRTLNDSSNTEKTYSPATVTVTLDKDLNLYRHIMCQDSFSCSVSTELAALFQKHVYPPSSLTFCTAKWIPQAMVLLDDLEGIYIPLVSVLAICSGTCLRRLINLTALDLSSNQFTGQIASAMQDLNKLTILRLHDNMLAGEIPTWLFKIRTLRDLYIGGKGSKLIWNNTTKVHPRCRLQEISMPSCGISGQIPEWISLQKELYVIDLSKNKLEGRFPDWLAKRNSIEVLFLSYNNLSGSIPPRLFETFSLLNLDLSLNNFSGELPKNIGNAKRLGWLFLSENNLSGRLPISISKLDNLKFLDLSKNKFFGDSLPVLGKSSYFELDLSDNDFSGKIPTNLPEGTRALYLGGNKFSGILPWNLTKLVKLRLLDLQNSNIIGNLQEILPQIPSLEILILRNNSINGFIPSTISNFSALRILDLSGNNLSGSIPYEIANLQRMIKPQETASSISHSTESYFTNQQAPFRRRKPYNAYIISRH